MSEPILVTIEHTPKKTFATAAVWPGWSRSGKTEALALEALAAYRPRYAAVATTVDPSLSGIGGVDDLEVVERVAGSAGTEFGVPSRPTDLDTRSLDAPATGRLVSLLAASWALFDRTAAAAPEELRKGPRGGGRNTSKVVAHVLDADRAYANEIGIKVAMFEPDDAVAIQTMRDQVLEVLRSARAGTPLGGRRWPARYAAHRIAWHALDHTWEIEDRSEPASAD